MANGGAGMNSAAVVLTLATVVLRQNGGALQTTFGLWVNRFVVSFLRAEEACYFGCIHLTLARVKMDDKLVEAVD
jgi:hypothetical protein